MILAWASPFKKIFFINISMNPLNPFHAFPGPCLGILIPITMPIPDRVRASSQLIHHMLNSRQVWSHASSVLQNIMGVYYSAIWWLFRRYQPLLCSG